MIADDPGRTGGIICINTIFNVFILIKNKNYYLFIRFGTIWLDYKVNVKGQSYWMFEENILKLLLKTDIAFTRNLHVLSYRFLKCLIKTYYLPLQSETKVS